MKTVKELRKYITDFPKFGKTKRDNKGSFKNFQPSRLAGNIPNLIFKIYREKDLLWTVIWISGLSLLHIWDSFFLNQPAFEKVQQGLFHTFLIATLVILFTLFLGWVIGVTLEILENHQSESLYLLFSFLLNIFRSIPQIVGILIGYVLITLGIQEGKLNDEFTIMLLMSLTISMFVFLELVDLIRDRIKYYKTLDFYNAMLVCGIPEWRIINKEILWKNSLAHIFNKLIAIFGVTIFLQCSIDFIISVGLSTEVSSVNLPVTLGSLLAKIDSKQDILAIGHTLMNPGYIGNLFFEHLQGITVAFLIVFSLICMYKISNGFAERYDI